MITLRIYAANDLMQHLNWIQFDWAVETITTRYVSHSFSGVYGVPRGGVCLAVALSHSLTLPFGRGRKPQLDGSRSERLPNQR